MSVRLESRIFAFIKNYYLKYAPNSIVKKLIVNIGIISKKIDLFLLYTFI